MTMKTMKMSVMEFINKEVEFELPTYRKDNYNFYKVMDKEDCITVCTSDMFLSISRSIATSVAFQNCTTPCTMDEFENAYRATLTKLHHIALVNEENDESIDDDDDVPMNEREDISHWVNKAHEASEGMER